MTFGNNKIISDWKSFAIGVGIGLLSLVIPGISNATVSLVDKMRDMFTKKN